jgi:hypothetical protein
MDESNVMKPGTEIRIHLVYHRHLMARPAVLKL